jgi:hypothetical protein
MRTFANIYWPIWIVVLFGVPEAVALLTKHPEGTLSDWVWRVFDVLPGDTLWEWKAAHLLLLCFMVWLTLHLAFRIWR